MKLELSRNLSIELGVRCDLDYHYKVILSESYELVYTENDGRISSNIGFGSLDEMESVARAMLKAVQMAREIDKEAL